MEAGGITSGDENARTGAPDAEPRLAAVTFVTTEHHALQSARVSVIAESTSRAAIFIGSVSAGLIALGLLATVTHIGTAFQVLSLILLSTLSFIGFATFDRVLQSAIEDLQYAERIARLRAYYFDFAPELTHYLASVPLARRLATRGFHGWPWQAFWTPAGMIGMVTAVLTGSAVGQLAAIASGHSHVAGLVTDGVVSASVLVALMWFQHRAWEQARRERLFGNEQEKPEVG